MQTVKSAEKSSTVKRIPNNTALISEEKPIFDLLVIDDNESWQEIIKEALVDKKHDTAFTYKQAIKKIKENKYGIICLSNLNNWLKLLSMLKEDYPETPVVIITSDLFEGNIRNIQSRYPNIKKVIFKGREPDFVSDIKETLANLFSD
jgi:CheY-like chemotaxis protein